MGITARTKKREARKPSWWDASVTRQKAAATKLERERRQAKLQQMIEGLVSLNMAMDWLDRHGLAVISYENGCFAKPSIQILHGTACADLKQTPRCYDRKSVSCSSGAPLRWWRAELMGCYIDWSERMH